MGLIIMQNGIIAVLALNYSGKVSTAALFVTRLAASAMTLFGKDIPLQLDKRKMANPF
jgi:hypothetical protein